MPCEAMRHRFHLSIVSIVHGNFSLWAAIFASGDHYFPNPKGNITLFSIHSIFIRIIFEFTYKNVQAIVFFFNFYKFHFYQTIHIDTYNRLYLIILTSYKIFLFINNLFDYNIWLVCFIAKKSFQLKFLFFSINLVVDDALFSFPGLNFISNFIYSCFQVFLYL